MATALIYGNIVTLLTYLILVATGIHVYMNPEAIRGHFPFAVIASIFVLLPPCMTMFYFIGTGKQMKEEIAKRKLDDSYLQPIRAFKKRVFPFATMAMLFYIFTFLNGGAVDTQPSTLNRIMHPTLTLIVLLLLLIYFKQAFKSIHENVRLIIRIGDNKKYPTDNKSGPVEAQG